MVDLNKNIPLEVLQQYFIESQPQTLGYAPNSINEILQPSGDVSNQSIYNTDIQNAPSAPAQNVANRCTMVSTQFAGSYSGNSNPNRSYLLIQNNGGSTMYIVVAGVATSGAGLQIAVGGYWEPLVVPTNTFSILGSGIVLEGTSL